MEIIYAEDNILNQKLMSVILKRIGCTLKIVENGQRLLEEIELRKYHIVFIDVQMPILDGIRATKELRRRGYEAPIVGLSAFSSEEYIRLGIESGMNEYLTKPISLKEIHDIIEKYRD